MYKKLLDITFWQNHFEISSYSFFLVLAAILAIVTTLYISTRRKQDIKKTIVILLFTIVMVVLGARASHFITNYDLYKTNIYKLFSPEFANFDMYNGIIIGCISGVFICRVLKVDLWKTSDCIAPGLAVGIICTRIGCFLNGCCVGLPAKLPWAVSFPIAKTYDGPLSQFFPAFTAPLHPTQIYEIIAAIAGMVIMIIIFKKNFKDGTAALVFSIIYTAFRLLNGTLRAPVKYYSLPDFFDPALYSISILILVTILIYRYKDASVFHKTNISPTHSRGKHF